MNCCKNMRSLKEVILKLKTETKEYSGQILTGTEYKQSTNSLRHTVMMPLNQLSVC